MYDILIIGGGVTGCSIARELSKYKCNILVLEKESDICEGTSKANSGIVHAGFDNEPGSVMAAMNVRGNELMEPLSKELDFSFERNGSLVLCFDIGDMDKLKGLMDKGIKNGVPNLEIISGDEVRKMEPAVSDKVVAALYAPSGGIVCPFGLTIAMAENAVENGVEFKRDVEVLDVKKCDSYYRVKTSKGEYQSKIIINAAGVFADKIHNMVSSDKMEIIPRKGEYCLMDKEEGNLVKRTIFQLPTIYGKGVLITHTVHGNLLTGPTAVDIEDKDNTATTAYGLEDVLKRVALSVPNVPARKIITSFAGLRAHLPQHDFVIEEVHDSPGFIDVAGIESPGLSSAPAVAEYVAKIVDGIISLDKKDDFKSLRKSIPNVAAASFEEREKLIAKDHRFANVVCRCELVTEGEIIEAINRPCGARTLDGVKRRTRAAMGRCQSGFCAPKIVEILAREISEDIGQVTKSGKGAEFLCGLDKEAL